jgi:hypothetical protein
MGTSALSMAKWFTRMVLSGNGIQVCWMNIPDTNKRNLSEKMLNF